MKVKAANGLARILKAEGIPWVTTFPTVGVNNALGQEGVPMLMMRDERYAVAVADAFSRVTGGKRIGVCTVMGGANAAGTQMAYGALAQAFEDSSPVLCITDGVPVGGASITHWDMALGMRSVTKWVGKIERPESVPDVMRRAFTLLRTGRPGPVVVSIPRGLGEYDEEEHPYAPVKGWKASPDPDDVRAAVKALLAATNPLIYVGEGVLYADAAPELLQFAELVQAPVMTTLKAKSAFPDSNPLATGVRGEITEYFLKKADLVFAIGSSLTPGRFSHAIPDVRHKSVVQCVVDELDINRNFPVTHALLGDAKLALRALVEEVQKQTGGAARKRPEVAEEVRKAKQEMMAKYAPALESSEKPINPYRVYNDLQKTLDPRHSFITADSGNTRDQLSTTYQAMTPHGYYGWGNISTLGFGLAAAAGAKLAYPDWQCVNVTGDAGVGYMLGNFEALVRCCIGVTTVHINNGGFAGYGPGFWGQGHDPFTFKVSDESVVGMAHVMEHMGYYAERVTEPDGIVPALRRALDHNAKGQPAYLEVICCQYPVFGKWVTEGPGFH